MRQLLRDRRFRLLFAGQVTSMLGDSLLTIVLAIWMKDLTGSSSAAGAVMLAVVAPMLASPLLGRVADRLRRRPFVIWTNILSGAARLPLLYPNAAAGITAIPLLGLGVSFAIVAYATLMQRTTPQEVLGRVSTATDLLIGAPQTLSIAAGAMLVARVDYRWIFAVASIGLLAAATSLWTHQPAQARAPRLLGAADITVSNADADTDGDMRGSPHGA